MAAVALRGCHTPRRLWGDLCYSALPWQGLGLPVMGTWLSLGCPTVLPSPGQHSLEKRAGLEPTGPGSQCHPARVCSAHTTAWPWGLPGPSTLPPGLRDSAAWEVSFQVSPAIYPTSESPRGEPGYPVAMATAGPSHAATSEVQRYADPGTAQEPAASHPAPLQGASALLLVHTHLHTCTPKHECAPMCTRHTATHCPATQVPVCTAPWEPQEVLWWAQLRTPELFPHMKQMGP